MNKISNMNKTRNILGCAAAASLLAACGGGTSSIPSSQSASQPNMMVRTPVVSPYALRDEHGRIVPHAHVMLTRRAAQQVLKPLGHSGNAGNNLSYLGGPIQSTPSVYVVFWGFGTYGDPSGEQSYMTNFLANVGGSSWLNIDHQYYQNSGKLQCSVKHKGSCIYIGNPTSQLKGTWNDDSPVPSSPNDAAIAAEAVNLANHFGGADPNASYVVATPTGHNTNGFGYQWCGYHNYNGVVRYTDIGYMADAGYSCGQNFINPGSAGNNDGVSIIAGHELAETQTDPQPGNSWVDLHGQEIADKCAWSPYSADVSFGGSTLGTNEFPVQPLWSNAVSGCNLSY
jgi:serine protease